MNGSQRISKLLLWLHSIAYVILFVYAIDAFKFGSYYVHDYFIVLLFWTPILLLHVGATYYQIGRGDISKLERDAYRDGFADAMRQLGAPPERIERLALDDEGELVELPKRKRE